MMELVCPAGSLPALKAAVDNGADAVYLGFRNETNARNFSGLNFSDAKLQQSLAYAREHQVKVFIAINTYPQPQRWQLWRDSIDMAHELNVNAVIVADIGLMDYATQNYPELPLHLSVQASATNHEALRFYQQRFNIRRAVVPRVLSLSQVQNLVRHSPVDLEVFAFGSLCIMSEGRCHLSSYVTGESPNMSGVCSPAEAVNWQQNGEYLETRLNSVLIDRFARGENAGYPTLCKGRFAANGAVGHILEEPTSLNTMALIPQLASSGIKALKIEGRQRSPAYVAQVVRVWRQALDAYYRDPDAFQVEEDWGRCLQNVSEGSQTTLGAYSRPWQ